MTAASPLSDSAAGLPDYYGLEVLSPMFRASALPLRLSCLRYGAGLVYSGVTIDHLLLETRRVENAAFGIVEYLHKLDDKVVFSTCQEEREHLIFQLGTRDAGTATKAALSVCRDVRGIDINMGCTAPFSTSGGMGSELLRRPALVADLLKTLRRELPADCALSCKIRMQSTVAETCEFMQVCERSGVNAIAVHLRTAEENRECTNHPARWRDVAELSRAVNVPVLANGDFLTRSCIEEFWDQHGSSGDGNPAGIMIARGALWNPSIFSKQGDVPFDDVVRSYIETAADVNNVFTNTKWTLREMLGQDVCRQSMLSYRDMQGAQLRRWIARLDQVKDMQGLCDFFGVKHDASAYPQGAFELCSGRRQSRGNPILAH